MPGKIAPPGWRGIGSPVACLPGMRRHRGEAPSARLEKERRFHDRRFRGDGHDVRASIAKYYSVYTLNTAYFDALMHRHLPGADVLEYGCAKGEKALRWARAGARIKGIDISGQAVRIANEHAGRAKLRAEFLEMNAEQTEFVDASFDVVFGEGARVLKPTGRAIFIEPLGHNPVLNLYRKLTPAMRTEGEHPLLMRDLQLMGRYFERVHVKYFHLTTLAAVPFRKSAVFKPLLALLQGIDRTLMTLVPPIQRWAWIAVIDMVRPRRPSRDAAVRRVSLK
jgi:SAM-dependent methyltransferase